METLTGFIPAGGQGSRLRPHTDNIPKPMLIMGSPDRVLIDTPLDALDDSCDDVYLTSHYRAEALAEKLEEHPDVQVLHETHALGNAGAFIEHYDRLSQLDKDGSIVIIPSDPVVEGLSLDEFRRAHLASGADVTAMSIPPKEYGLYVRASDGFARGYTKQDDPNAASTTGIYMVKNSYLMDWAWRVRREGRTDEAQNLTYDLVEPAILAGKAALFPLAHGGYWDDAGTHDRYHVNNMRLSGGANVVSRTANIDPQAVVDRCVVLGGVVFGPEMQLSNAIVSQQADGLQITQI